MHRNVKLAHMLHARCATLVRAAAGGIVGASQYGVALAGMHAAAKTEGLAGIGVAARYALGWLAVSLLLLLAVCAALRLRRWALAALLLLAGQLLVIRVVWRYSPIFGLHGDRRAWLFIPAAILALTVGGALLQRPEDRSGKTRIAE